MKRRCPLSGCARSVPEGEGVCRQCWVAIPICYRLALLEHRDLTIDPSPVASFAEDREPRDANAWRRFVEASRATLLAYIQANIWGWRYLRRTDPDAWELAA